ncbi:MAG: hypothetical protein AAGG09_01615 [Pseudomonadota bacterium]
MTRLIPAAAFGLIALTACVPEPPPPASAEDQAKCRTDVQFETNNPTVNVTSSESTELGSIVRLSVGDEAAPWRCVVDLNGETQIQSLTNEGFL